MIEINGSAEALLFDKANYFEKKGRFPRLVITERSCRGRDVPSVFHEN